MLPNLSIRDQITIHASEGNKYLIEASQSRNRDAYENAIQAFASSYKLALLLNSDDGIILNCAFNLGAAHVAGGTAARGVALLQTVLDQAKKNQSNFTSRDGDIYFNLAVGHTRIKEPDRALQFYFHAMDEYSKERNNQEKLSETHLKIADLLLARNDNVEAQKHFASAARLYHEIGDLDNATMSRVCQANAAISDDTFSQDDSYHLLEECCQECSKLNNNNLQAKIFCEVGVLFSKLGHHKHALECFKATIHLYSNNSNLRRKAVALQNAGAILNLFGQYSESVMYHSKAAQLHGKLGNRNAQGQSFCNLGFAESQLQNYETSREAYLHSLQAFKDTRDMKGQWQSHEGLAAVCYIGDDLKRARLHYQMALLTQAKCPVIDKVAQERLVFKLTSVLESEVDTSRQAIEHPTLMIEDNQNQQRSSPEPELRAEDFIIEDSPPDNSAQPRRSRRKSHRKKKYKGVRRQYSDENSRPIKHVARGFSGLTQSTLRESGLQEELNSSSEDDVPLSLQKRETLRQIFQSVMKPMETLADNTVSGRSSTPVKQFNSKRYHGSGQLSQSGLLTTEGDTAREETSMSARSDLSEQNLAQFYRKQLSEITENTDEESSFTSISSGSSSDSTSDEGKDILQSEPASIKRNTPVKPKRSKLSVGTPLSETNATEPVYSETIKSRTQASQPQDIAGTSTHLYESIKTMQLEGRPPEDHNGHADHSIEEVAQQGLQDPNETTQQDPHSSHPPVHSPKYKNQDDFSRGGSGNHNNGAVKFQDPPIYLHEPASPHVGTAPTGPHLQHRPATRTRAGEQNKPSKSCIVM